jgi:hypothetical protein
MSLVTTSTTTLLGYIDYGVAGGGEPAAELLRPGRAGPNTVVDHIAVFDAAFAQLPAPLRQHDEHGRVPVLVRTDAAGATKQSAAHLHAHGVEFSLGASLGHFDIHTALTLLPQQAWTPAYQPRKPPPPNGVQIEPRDGAWVAEATDLVDMSSWPPGTRLILRKERPHPRRPAADHRRRRVAGDRVSDHHRAWWARPPAGRPRAAAPPPRPGRGPDPGGVTCPSTT